MDPKTLAKLRQQRLAGIPRAEVAREAGVHPSTVEYHEQKDAAEVPLAEPRKEAVSDVRPKGPKNPADYVAMDAGGVRRLEARQERIARLLSEDHVRATLADLLDPAIEGVSREERLKSLTLAVQKGLIEIDTEKVEAPAPLTRAARMDWTKLLLGSFPEDELTEIHEWIPQAILDKGAPLSSVHPQASPSPTPGSDLSDLPPLPTPDAMPQSRPQPAPSQDPAPPYSDASPSSETETPEQTLPHAPT